MAVPQFGTFAQRPIAHEFIEFDLRQDVPLIAVDQVLDGLRAPAVAAGGVNLVLAFAFAADRARFERMLERVLGTDADGLHDRLIDFSRPVSGAYWFAPSLAQIANRLGRCPVSGTRPGTSSA